MKIYFEDGKLCSFLPIKMDYRIDAGDGFSRNAADLELYMETNPSAAIYTNSLAALSNKYVWNETLRVPELYIRAGEYMAFTRIDELTTRELRQGHNLMRMYIAGEFNR